MTLWLILLLIWVVLIPLVACSWLGAFKYRQERRLARFLSQKPTDYD